MCFIWMFFSSRSPKTIHNHWRPLMCSSIYMHNVIWCSSPKAPVQFAHIFLQCTKPPPPKKKKQKTPAHRKIFTFFSIFFFFWLLLIFIVMIIVSRSLLSRPGIVLDMLSPVVLPQCYLISKMALSGFRFIWPFIIPGFIRSHLISIKNYTQVE